MIAMAVMLKIIYENSDIKLSKFFINFVEMASCIHVIATIMQLINPGFIQNINTSILGSAGIKTNLELLKVGSYAGITAQTAVNAYYITIFICIKFSKILTEKRYKVINVMWLLVAIIALFLTGKRGMVICIIISSSILYLYKMRSNYKKIVKRHLNDIKESIKSSKNNMEEDFYKGRYAVQLSVYARALNVQEKYLERFI